MPSTGIGNLRNALALSKRPRLLLADSQQLMLDGLRLVLEPECEILATFTDGASLLAEAEKHRPDLILTDFWLPAVSGIEVVRRLRRVLPSTKAVFLTTSSTLASILGSLGTERESYILKQCSSSELRAAVKQVLRGGVYVPPLMKKPPGKQVEISSPALHTAARLTQRQKAVLQLVAEGLPERDIAAVLGISVKTVAFHKTAIKSKLNINTTAALTRYALQHGVIS
jgi:DNA-binding NarL/FixJ family response regulator